MKVTTLYLALTITAVLGVPTSQQVFLDPVDIISEDVRSNIIPTDVVRDNQGYPVLTNQSYYMLPVNQKNVGGGFVLAIPNGTCPLEVVQTRNPKDTGFPVKFGSRLIDYVRESEDLRIRTIRQSGNFCKQKRYIWGLRDKDLGLFPRHEPVRTSADPESWPDDPESWQGPSQDFFSTFKVLISDPELPSSHVYVVYFMNRREGPRPRYFGDALGLEKGTGDYMRLTIGIRVEPSEFVFVKA